MLFEPQAAPEPSKTISVASRRDPLFFLAALLVHAAGLLSAGAIARAPSALVQDPSLAAHIDLVEVATNGINPIEVDLLPDTPAWAPDSNNKGAPAGIAAAAHTPRLGSSVPRSRERAPAQVEPTPNTEPAPAEGPSAADPGWLPNESPDRAPGLNGPPVWMIPGVLTSPSAANTTKPLAPRATGAAPPPGQNPSEEQKQTALLPAAGTLGSAVAEEVAASSAPLTSESHFKLTLDAQGRLVSALFLSANEGDRAGWERVARAVAKRFAGKTMPMPSAYAAGGTVYVSIRSRVVMPDGTSHGAPTPRSITEKAPDNEYGRIDSPLNDRFRSPMTSTSPAPNKITIGVPFKFDLSNLGATRRRVVSAQVRAVPISP